MRFLTGLIFALAVMVHAAPLQAMLLHDALVSTYEYNPQLKAELAALQATKQSKQQAYANWLPTVQYNYTKGDETSEFGSDPEEETDTTQKTLTVSQPLFQGGNGIFSVRRANHLVSAQEMLFQRAEQDVLLQAITAYMNLIEAMRVFELAQNNLKLLAEHLIITNQRFQLGEVTRTDVEQAKARYAQAKTDRIEGEGDEMKARANFRRVIGVEPTNLSMPTVLPTLPRSLDETIEIALETNPSLSQTLFEEKVGRDDTYLALSNMLPEASFNARYVDEEGRALFGGRELKQQIYTVDATIPLFQGGRAYSRYKESKKRARELKYRHLDSKNRTRQAAIEAWEEFQVSKATVSSNLTAVKAAKLAYEGAMKEAEVGARTVIDVLDAEQELFVSKNRLVRAQRDAIVSGYELLAVIGKLTARDLNLVERMPENQRKWWPF